MFTNFLQLQTYKCGPYQIDVCVPEAGFVQRLYRGQKDSNAATPFPYWTQVWPSALAMAQYLAMHPDYITNKTVLELAAGLGLPSLLASRWAKYVICSDYLPEAVTVMQRSVQHNKLTNVNCEVLNWHNLPKDLTAEVLLLSDINYEPSQFDVLYELLVDFLKKETLVLLTTPQRLMAKPFMERLMPLAISCQEIVVSHQEQQFPITLLVLKINRC